MMNQTQSAVRIPNSGSNTYPVMNFTAEMSTSIFKDGKTTAHNIAEAFSLTYLRGDKDEMMFRRDVKNRYLLNERNFVIKNLNKSQKLALKVAAINDVLVIKVDSHFKMLQINNTKEIRDHWAIIKSELLIELPDISEMVEDFDWQLKEENIQEVFLNDNFLQHLFSNTLSYHFSNKNPLLHERIIANGVGTINIPVVEKKTINTSTQFLKQDNVIRVIAEIDEQHCPVEKLNVFIGELDTMEGEDYPLDLKYIGEYVMDDKGSQVIEGKVEYTFSIGELYLKTNTYNFKLEDHE